MDVGALRLRWLPRDIWGYPTRATAVRDTAAIATARDNMVHRSHLLRVRAWRRLTRLAAQQCSAPRIGDAAAEGCEKQDESRR